MENETTTGHADLLELMLVLAREKRQIVLVTLGAAVLAAIIVFLVPKSYTATSTILPPQENQSVLSSMLGQVAGAQALDLRDLGLKNPSDVRKVYNVKRYEDARKKLEKRSEIDPEKEGLISIAVTDNDPKRAADIANAWVDELRVLNINLALTEAAQRRVFFEQKLAAERASLTDAELALRQLEQKTGLIQPDAQTRALIGEVADMRAQIAAKQVQLQSMRSYATENNPDVKRAERELAELQSQSSRLSQTERGGGDVGEGNLQVPTGRVATANFDYLRLARELKYHESLYDFLSRQLEAARIDEAKNAVLVQTVDRAVEPEKKSGPKRMLIVAVTALLALVLVCFVILMREAVRRKQQNPVEAERLAQLNRYLRSPL
jgi:tyrosine-protein kinase Etk/Wzc